MARPRVTAETFSLAITGAPAHGKAAGVKTVTIGDSAARPTQQQQAMMTGAHILCRNSDGSTGFYVLDAERSTPSNPVLRPV